MSRKHVFPKAAHHMSALINRLVNKYHSSGYETQVLEMVDTDMTGKIFQVRHMPEKQWISVAEKITGLDTAGTVKLIEQGEDLEVDVIGGKWLDKVAVSAVSLVVLWPLLITAGIGSWKQKKLLDELYQDTALFLAELSETSKPLLKNCPACGTSISPGTRFCGNCGSSIG
jgi:hypothetical protein